MQGSAQASESLATFMELLFVLRLWWKTGVFTLGPQTTEPLHLAYAKLMKIEKRKIIKRNNKYRKRVNALCKSINKKRGFDLVPCFIFNLTWQWKRSKAVRTISSFLRRRYDLCRIERFRCALVVMVVARRHAARVIQRNWRYHHARVLKAKALLESVSHSNTPDEPVMFYGPQTKADHDAALRRFQSAEKGKAREIVESDLGSSLKLGFLSKLVPMPSPGALKLVGTIFEGARLARPREITSPAVLTDEDKVVLRRFATRDVIKVRLAREQLQVLTFTQTLLSAPPVIYTASNFCSKPFLDAGLVFQNPIRVADGIHQLRWVQGDMGAFWTLVPFKDEWFGSYVVNITRRSFTSVKIDYKPLKPPVNDFDPPFISLPTSTVHPISHGDSSYGKSPRPARVSAKQKKRLHKLPTDKLLGPIFVMGQDVHREFVPLGLPILRDDQVGVPVDTASLIARPTLIFGGPSNLEEADHTPDTVVGDWADLIAKEALVDPWSVPDVSQTPVVTCGHEFFGKKWVFETIDGVKTRLCPECVAERKNRQNRDRQIREARNQGLGLGPRCVCWKNNQMCPKHEHKSVLMNGQCIRCTAINNRK